MKIIKKYCLTLFLVLMSVVVIFCIPVLAQQTGTAAPTPMTPTAIDPACLPTYTINGEKIPSTSPLCPAPAAGSQTIEPAIRAVPIGTAAQQEAIQQELVKSGGELTPQAIEALKQRPEFKNVSPEDVEKGKKILEQKEKKEQIKTEKSEKKELPATGKTVIKEQEEEESLFHRTHKVGKYQDVSLKLNLFGSELFRDAAVRLVTDRKDIPVPAQYIVGPGDEIKLLLWGRLNAQYNLTVDRDGKITVPQIGPLYVAGMTFEQMSKYLVKQAGQVVGTNVDISMGSLKTISVFILGDVKRPGSYTIGSFSTVTDALFMTGGPSSIGSMRRIQVMRKDQLLTTFDLYDLLLKGDKSKDVILQSGDVIFVPVTGPQVGVAGNVKRPAIYELKDKYDLQNLLDYAGGIIPTAYTQQIQVERVVKGENQIVVDINDKNLEKAIDFGLHDADLVKIFSIVDTNVNAIYLNGNVKRPGKYEYKTGMTIHDIIAKPDELLPGTFYDYALIKRLQPPSMEPVLLPFNLGKYLFNQDKTNNIALQPRDQIFIFSKWFFRDKPHFTISGEVRKEGSFDLNENTSVKDAILAAEGLTKEADMEKGEILRSGKNKEYQTIYFNVSKALTDNSQDNIVLQDDDKIIIHSLSERFYKKTVSIEGDVLKPGTYQFTEQMTVKDLVFASGNILESAYMDEAEITSMVIDGGRVSRTELRNFNLRAALSGDPALSVQLKPYDRVFVKKITDWRREEFVNVTGEVKFPGHYAIRKGEKLSSLIDRAGGYTSDAYLRGAAFTRQSVRLMQQESIEEMARRTEKDLLTQGSRQVSASLSVDEVKAKEVELAQKQKFVEIIKKIKATGRMTIRLANQRLLKGSDYDIELKEGDSLHIPQKNSVVNVMGAVMVQASYIYLDKMDYRDYVSMAGGYSDYANTADIFVLKVDGSARRLNRGAFSWNDRQDRWELAAFGESRPAIEPGDTIIVPEKLESIAWLREIRDITQILMNIAVVAGITIAIL